VVHLGGLTGKDGDIARAIGFRWTDEGHEAFYYISKVLLDSRAAGIPYPMGGRGWWDIQDLEGLRKEAERTKNFGLTGMLLIHPSHVAIVNEVFTPTKEEIKHWKELIAAVEKCEKEGASVVTFNGVMVDTAHLKVARDMLAWAAELGVA